MERCHTVLLFRRCRDSAYIIVCTINIVMTRTMVTMMILMLLMMMMVTIMITMLMGDIYMAGWLLGREGLLLTLPWAGVNGSNVIGEGYSERARLTMIPSRPLVLSFVDALGLSSFGDAFLLLPLLLDAPAVVDMAGVAVCC